MADSETQITDLITTFQDELRPSSEPTQTLFDIIGRSTAETDWQQLLAYFLRPANNHGFGPELLNSLLTTIEKNTRIDRLDGPTEAVRVETEAKTPDDRRVDLLLTQDDEWFLCIELKVHASEHHQQTTAYADADYLGTRAKATYPDSGHNYLYLTPNETQPPTSETFALLDWETVAADWQPILENHRGADGAFPSRGVAQFAEFLELIRTEVGSPRTEMEQYYRDVDSAQQVYEQLATAIARALEAGVQDRTTSGEPLRVRRKRRGFPQFDHDAYNRIEIDKPQWQAGRSKPTIVIEFNFHLRPHLGPGETKQQPSVAVNLDIRGGSELKTRLREQFNDRVAVTRYREHGFGTPHTNPQWHFLTKEIRLDETTTPISDLLAAFDVLYQFEPTFDAIARHPKQDSDT